MKKLILLVIMLTNLLLVNAQTDTAMYVTDLPGDWHYICFNQYPTATVYAPDGCTSYNWLINNQPTTGNPITLNGNTTEFYHCDFVGGNCGQYSFTIIFKRPTTPTETTEELWKHQYEPITLEAIGADSVDMYTYYWPHNGATTATIEVVEPGTYTYGVSDMCATSVQTFIVQDNVEIDLSTCDLETNLNMITWQSNPAQAQYIDHVIVKRDGIQVGTANYADGQFLDAIGSGAASRTYTLVTVATDGTECPIVSYPKETIHMSYTLGMGNNIEMGWNIPTGYDLLGFNICEWHPDGKDGDLTVIDFVGASVTSYTCSENQFNNGYVVVQGVENGKTESHLLSNRSEEGIVGLEERQNKTFQIYPNPSNGTFIVEGAETLRIANVLGQEIMAKEIDGNTAIELPQGIYFVQLNGVVQKIVVE